MSAPKALAKRIRLLTTALPSGRKLNRRVDMVVSGDVIGTELSTPSIEACRGEPLTAGAVRSGC